MKERLDAIVFDGASNILIKDSKKNLVQIAADRNLGNDFYRHLDRQIAIFTQANNRGNTNTYMSFSTTSETASPMVVLPCSTEPTENKFSFLKTANSTRAKKCFLSMQEE